MSSNSFAALADVDEEATNQAGKKAQAVAGAIPHASASAGQKKPANGGDRKPVISERVIERHPQGDRKSGTVHGSGSRGGGGRTQKFGGSKSDVVKANSGDDVPSTPGADGADGESSEPQTPKGITLEEHRRQLEALRLAVQAEAAPAPARAIKEDLSGLKVIAKEDGAFVAPVEKAKSKKDRSQNKAVLDVADLFAAGPADAARTPRGGDRPARGGSEGFSRGGRGGSDSGRGGRGGRGGSSAGAAVNGGDFPALGSR